MPQLIRVEGSGGSFGLSRDLWPQDQQFVFEIFQQDHPVGDDELNLIQQIAEYNQRRMITGLLTDGLLLGGKIVCTDTLGTPVANSIYLNRGWWIVDHFPVLIENSQNVGSSLNLDNATLITLSAPPTGSTPRTDLVFLEFWFEEVAASGQTNASTSVYEDGGVGNQVLTNTILNPTLNTELTRRVQARWRVRTVSNATSIVGQTGWGATASNPNGYAFVLDTLAVNLYRAGPQDSDTIHAEGTLTGANNLGTVNGFTYAIQIATVNRNPNVSTITPADILSAPPQAQTHALVPQANIYPPLPNPLPGADLFPQTILYEGAAFDSTAGSGVSEQSLSAASLATNFTITKPSVPPGVLISANFGGPSVLLNRIELQVGARGSGGLGSDFLCQIVADRSGQPTGAVVSSFRVPRGWLLPAARYVSIPVNCQVLWNTKYWVVLTQTGSASGYVAWLGEATNTTTTVRSLATTGAITSTWPTSIANLHMNAYIDNPNGGGFSSAVPNAANPGGLAGAVRHTIEGTAPAVSVSCLEYDATGLTTVMAVAYDSSGAIVSANLQQVNKNPSTGAITGITQLTTR